MSDKGENSSFANCVVDHHKLVNKENYFPDVFFHLDEKNQLSAHYSILRMRIPQLTEDGHTANKKSKKVKGHAKDRKVVIKLSKSEKITRNALERVLGTTKPFSQLEMDTYHQAIEVMRACSLYNLKRLMQMNEKYLQDHLTMKNIFSLLQFADGLNVQEAKDICIEFAFANGDFFTSTNAEIIGFKLYQEVTSLYLKHHQNPDPEGAKMKIITVTEPDTIVADFSNLFDSADTTGDVTFVIRQTEVKAHKPLLSGLSSKMTNLLMQGEGEAGSVPIKLDTKYQRVSPEAFKSMLKFIYYGETNIDLLHACELMSFVKDYKLNKLYKVLENVIGNQEVTKETVLSVLDVAYHPLMEQNPSLQTSLKEEGLSFAVDNVDKINFDPLMTMDPLIGTHILQALQNRVSNKWSSVIDASATKKVKLSELNSGASQAWQPSAAASATTSPRSAVSEKSSESSKMKKPESKKDLAEDGGKTPKKGDKKAEEAKSPRSLGRTKSKHGSKADLKKDDKKKDGGKKKK